MVESMLGIIETVYNYVENNGFFSLTIGAVGGWIITLKTTKSRIKADLKASTRLKWIEDVRALTAKIIQNNSTYMSLAWEYDGKFKELENINDVHEQAIEGREIKKEFEKKSRGLVEKHSEDRNLYKLYFSRIKRRKWYKIIDIIKKRGCYQPNIENIEMHKYVDDILKQVNKIEEDLMKNGKLDKTVAEKGVIAIFRNKTSDYLKKEWDRAKNNG